MVEPVELLVEGRPPSQGTKNKESKAIWKMDVRKAVPSDAGLLEGPLRMCIDIYLRGEPPSNKPPDVDNMIKPILDALKGSDASKGYLYADDTIIEEICARRIDRDQREPDRDEASDALRRALGQWEEFVIMRVAPAP